MRAGDETRARRIERNRRHSFGVRLEMHPMRYWVFFVVIVVVIIAVVVAVVFVFGFGSFHGYSARLLKELVDVSLHLLPAESRGQDSHTRQIGLFDLNLIVVLLLG